MGRPAEEEEVAAEEEEAPAGDVAAGHGWASLLTEGREEGRGEVGGAVMSRSSAVWPWRVAPAAPLCTPLRRGGAGCS